MQILYINTLKLMKTSFYNIYVEDKEVVLLFNSLSYAFLVITPNQYKNLLECVKTNSWDKLTVDFYNNLVNNGFIITDDTNEQSILQNRLWQDQYASRSYSLMINSTLDCNLNCWYCYESHIKGSFLNEDIQKRIARHLDYKLETEPFKELAVSFFGGEPLLPISKTVLPLIENFKKFTNQNKIDLSLHFTTNGVAINPPLLEALKDIPTSFQITLDGDRQRHDQIRCLKNSSVGTFDIIIKNIKQIIKSIKSTHIILRINFTTETFDNIASILEDFDQEDSAKIVFSLHKVWQADEHTIDHKQVLDFIDYANTRGFQVDYGDVDFGNPGCYADKYNQVLINFDGSVYKCTARDFTKENQEGRLLEDGCIEWNLPKLQKRLNADVPEICRECKLLPCCSGFCCQHRVEQTPSCFRTVFPNIEDYIVYNFNRITKFSKS